ncbi:MAG TPA: hypothetical protein VFE01_07395 [Terracidiphilus sp.]|nr:hypothetical protein [Terracidiphilus sp.]
MGIDILSIFYEQKTKQETPKNSEEPVQRAYQENHFSKSANWITCIDQMRKDGREVNARSLRLRRLV